MLNKLSLHGEGLKIQNIASLLEEQARTKACARGKRTTWLLLWDIIFEIDRCHLVLSDDIIGGRGSIGRSEIHQGTGASSNFN